jgi:hypothetical protein
MVPLLENFVVHFMDFHMKQNIVVVNMDNNFVVSVKATGLFLKKKSSISFKYYLILFSRFTRGASHFGWIVLLIVILLVCILLWARRNRQRQSMLIKFRFLFLF